MKNFSKRCIYTLSLPFFIILAFLMGIFVFLFDKQSYIRIHGFWKHSGEVFLGVIDDYVDAMKNPEDWPIF